MGRSERGTVRTSRLGGLRVSAAKLHGNRKFRARPCRGAEESGKGRAGRTKPSREARMRLQCPVQKRGEGGHGLALSCPERCRGAVPGQANSIEMKSV